VLVLDEPTANLDAGATQRVLQPLRQLARTRTVIMISHDLTLGPAADVVLVLDGDNWWSRVTTRICCGRAGVMPRCTWSRRGDTGRRHPPT
jgi:ATP-binding cassette subfamily B protein